ncbi:MAG: hypothetical protein ABIX01_14605 [Chitinophagaceae bacterium]
MKKYCLFIIVIALATACKKRYADPTYAANATAVKVWFKSDAFYQPFSEIYIDSLGTWKSFKAFPLVYDNDPNKYGFGNPYIAGKGSNALYMTTMYSGLPGGVSSDSGTYNIVIPKCFEFIPTAAGATEGVVNVIPQKVKVTRKDKTSFQVGISGSGTYNEISKLFQVDISFDETEIGRGAEIVRKFRFQP